MHPTSNLRTWQYRDRSWKLGSLPLLMGIVNVTPDSFSDGGSFLQKNTAVEHGLKLIEEGAEILDVGGESTRPGAEPVSSEEERRRIIPVIQSLAAQTDVPISIDTTKANVAQAGVEAGAEIVNDISGLQFDPAMIDVCRSTEVGVICMHMQGTPQTMQSEPIYEDVVPDICKFFVERLEVLALAGIPSERIVLDPGIGFGKTATHNLEILSQITRFRELGRPVLIGHSRKRFLAKVLGRDVDERLMGTVGVSAALAMQSTDIIRVHDVRATRDALLAWHAIASRTVD